MRTLDLFGACVLAISFFGCGSSSSPATASDASTEARSDAGNACFSAGFTCETLGPMSVCQSAGPEYSCGHASETCCKRDSYLSVDSGFCVAVDGSVEGGSPPGYVGGVTNPTPGSCAGQPCEAGCSCVLQKDGVYTSPPSGKPACLCAMPPTTFCSEHPNCGPIGCAAGCTCSNPVVGTCVCPLDGGGAGDVAEAGSD